MREKKGGGFYSDHKTAELKVLMQRDMFNRYVKERPFVS